MTKWFPTARIRQELRRAGYDPGELHVNRSPYDHTSAFTVNSGGRQVMIYVKRPLEKPVILLYPGSSDRLAEIARSYTHIVCDHVNRGTTSEETAVSQCTDIDMLKVGVE